MNILITGATRGIGYHMALEFIKRGHRVFGIGRGWENPADTEKKFDGKFVPIRCDICLLYTSPSPRDRTRSRMPSSA